MSQPASSAQSITASFRDPAGSLFRYQGRVLRVVNAIGAADLDAFLEQERKRYAEQLEGYAKLMHDLQSRRVKVALYFPLLKRLVEWEPRHG